MEKKLKNNKSSRGQVTLEFTICVIIIFLMVYSMVKVFEWSGIDLSGRRQVHQVLLSQGDINIDFAPENSSCVERVGSKCRRVGGPDVLNGPIKQILPTYYKPTQLKIVFPETFYGSDTAQSK